jgi:hypothetical protein
MQATTLVLVLAVAVAAQHDNRDVAYNCWVRSGCFEVLSCKLSIFASFSCVLPSSV